MRRSNVALRLQTSLLGEAKRVAESEGVALNQLINVAVAEKLSALRTAEYFRERASRANITKAKRNPEASGSREASADRRRTVDARIAVVWMWCDVRECRECR
jgi:hypothetical protein